MSSEQIRHFLREVPFHPFTVSLSDGSSLKVTQPDFALLMPNGATLFVGVVGEPAAHRVQVSQIVSVTSDSDAGIVE